MSIQYFKSAWGDIKNSPGWFGKLCLLALLNLIPIFGQIVTFGYLYGWAREIAWCTHEPMPRSIFANEDGKFWRRGWFVFVLTAVFALVPYLVIQLGNYFQVQSFISVYTMPHSAGNPLLDVVGNMLVLVGYVGTLLLGVLAWIGNMRISIYDRLSAGFQFGKIWKMLRHDTTGILKIFGMNLLVNLVTGFILSIVFFMLILIVAFAGVAGLMNAGYLPQSLQYLTETQLANLLVQFFASAGIVGIFALLIGTYLAVVASVFVQVLVVRAVGYWTMQFEVVKWRGQDDPLPFEVPVAPSSPSYQQPMDAWGRQQVAQPLAQSQAQQTQGAQPQVVQPQVVQSQVEQPQAEQPQAEQSQDMQLPVQPPVAQPQVAQVEQSQGVPAQEQPPAAPPQITQQPQSVQAQVVQPSESVQPSAPDQSVQNSFDDPRES